MKTWLEHVEDKLIERELKYTMANLYPNNPEYRLRWWQKL